MFGPEIPNQLFERDEIFRNLLLTKRKTKKNKLTKLKTEEKVRKEKESQKFQRKFSANEKKGTFFLINFSTTELNLL